MVIITHKLKKVKKLSQVAEKNRHKEGSRKSTVIKRMADPHLSSHKIKGVLYYTYRRGVDKEIYLGTADAILVAVMTARGSK